MTTPNAPKAAAPAVAEAAEQAKLWISEVVIAAHRRSPAQTKIAVEALEAFIDLLAAAPQQVAAWMPIQTVPASGYFLVCDEDGESVRTKLRHDGQWLDVEYPFIEHAPWGDKSVGADALRILRLAQADPMCPMKLGISDGCPEPAFWCAFPKFDAAPPSQASATGEV